MRTDPNENVVTFVQEGMTHAVNFIEEPSRKLAAINVSACHILEISNRSADRKREVMSLSHFMVPHITQVKNLDNSMLTVFKNFYAKGGRLETAEFRIYGGVEGENAVLRSNLKESILKLVPGAKIEEPRGHEVKRGEFFGGESCDYLFEKGAVTFCKADSDGELTKDSVSPNLLTSSKVAIDPEKLASHDGLMRTKWNAAKLLIESQTRSVIQDLEDGEKVLKAVFEKIPEAKLEMDSGDKRKMAAIVGMIESQVNKMSLKVCDSSGISVVPAISSSRSEGTNLLADSRESSKSGRVG